MVEIAAAAVHQTGNQRFPGGQERVSVPPSVPVP
jgi:hypothetical protein